MKGEKIKYLPLILSLLMVLSIASIAFAQELPLMYVDPPEVSQNPPGSFTVSINIQNVIDLFSYEAKLGYDPNILEVTSVVEGPFIKDQTTSPLGTLFSTVMGADYVYAVCVTMGKYPGITGSGNLFNVTFNIVDAGACDLDLYESTMLDSTGTLMSHDVADGVFETPARGNLVRRSAWPEHHHFVVSKDEDGNQTLNAKAKNLGTIDLLIMIVFDIVRDDSLVESVSSDAVLVAPGTIVEFSADFGPLEPADAGKYYVSARAYYSWSGDNWYPGVKVKTFSFAVVP